MSGFFSNESTDDVGALTMTANSIVSESSFFATNPDGTIANATIPFDGKLDHSDAMIGHVIVDNQPSTVAIGSMPPVRGVVSVSNFPTTIAVSNPPETQAVTGSVTVAGTVSVANQPTEIRVNNVDPMPVRIVASDVQLGGGTGGGDAFDGIVRNTVSAPVNVKLVSTDVTVNGSVSLASGSNVGITGLVGISSLPPVSGSVSISNFPVAPTSLTINNAASNPVPVALQNASVTIANPVTAVSITNLPTKQKIDDTTAIRVEVTNQVQTGGSNSFDGNVTVKAGTAHIGSVGIDGTVKIDTSTPLQVTVTNPSSGGGGGGTSFNGVLANSNATIGTVNIAGPLEVGGEVTLTPDSLIQLTANSVVGINDTKPIRVEVTNQVQTGGGSTSFDGNVTVRNDVLNTSERASIKRSVAMSQVADTYTVIDRDAYQGIRIHVVDPTDWSTRTIDGHPYYEIYGGTISYVIEGSDDESTWTQLGTAAVDPSQGVIGDQVIFENSEPYIQVRYVRVKIDRSSLYLIDSSTYPQYTIANFPVDTLGLSADQFKIVQVAQSGNFYVQPSGGEMAVRLKGTAANGSTVNLGTDTAPVSVKVVSAATQTVNGTVSLGAGTAAIGTVNLAAGSTVRLDLNNQNGSIPVTQQGPVSATLTNPFDGALRLAGLAVSNSNRLPVDVGNPTVKITAADGSSPIPVVVSNALKVEIDAGANKAGSYDYPFYTVYKGIANVTVANPVTSVTVSNLPATQAVSIANTVNVAGTVTIANPISSVSISNFPATQTIAGTVTLSNPFDGALKLAGNAVSSTNRLPVDIGSPTVSLASNAVTVSGSVAISNPVTSVAVNNFPAVQAISGTVSLASNAVTVSGSVNATIQGTPAVTATITGTPSVNATIQGTPTVTLSSNAVTVSGSVAVSALPTVNVNTHAVTVQGAVTQQYASVASYTDRSGSIATAGASQVLFSANASRVGAWVQNLSTGDLYISEIGSATTGGSSLKIPAGGLYEYPVHGVPQGAVNIIGANAGQAFSARTW
ncbi:beta strand repeat-containing protein [Methylobacterium sp. HMF5984]|uniref:beta strand repeat-containing protein n=1 Tax=Methylobacterium sp. HMF5984 TaxID=3367370 RepID=UPI00385377AE